MIFVSWNINGLRSYQQKYDLKEFLEKYQIDIPKQNRNNNMFTAEERERIGRFSDIGMIDVFLLN